MLDVHEFERMLHNARAGEGDALGGLLKQWRDYLLVVANDNLDDGIRAKESPSDLVQETFLEAKRDFAQFHGKCEEEFRAWLTRILKNNLAAAAKKYRDTEKRDVSREVPLSGPDDSGHVPLDLPQDTPLPCERVIGQEDLAALHQALARLPERYRQVLGLRYERQLGFEAIGGEMGCSAEAARKVWARALAALQREMSPSHDPS
jgi:RNA polymerase sigma-70 factor (ECF subfamily)